MSSSALKTQGTTLKVSDGASPEVYTAIGEISNISGPDGTAPEIDVTDMDSTAKEYLLGLPDEGNVTFNVFFVPQDTQHAQLWSDKTSGTARNYRITMTDSPQSTLTFSARVSGLSLDFGTDAATTGSVTLRISGSVTMATG